LKGFPEDIALCFLCHCSTRELLKSLKKTLEALYAVFSEREATVKVDNVKKFMLQLLEKLIRPKDVEFKKVKLLLFYVHHACKQMYPNAAESDVLRYGVINLLFRLIQKALDDPYSGVIAYFPFFLFFLFLC
jgi:hypothetical protein